MKHKKVLPVIMAVLLCVGLFSGCGKQPWDFKSSEEAQKYVLSTLKDKYKESFVFTEEPQYKEEKIGIYWISGEVAPEGEPEKAAVVYARNTGLFEDTYHTYYFSDQIKELAAQIFKDKDYIRETEITVKGRSTDTKWTGKESLDEYLEKGEYQIIADVYLYENLTDEEYVEQICLLIEEISGCGLHVQLDIWDKADRWIFRAFPDDGEMVNDREYILEQIHANRDLRESMDNYEEWKRQNETENSEP